MSNTPFLHMPLSDVYYFAKETEKGVEFFTLVVDRSNVQNCKTIARNNGKVFHDAAQQVCNNIDQIIEICKKDGYSVTRL